jgi:hypothetical protein
MRRSRSAGAAGAADERRMCRGGAPAVRRRGAAWSPEMRRICGQWAAVSGRMRWRKCDRADATRGMMLLRQSLDVRVEFLRILVGAYSSWAEGAGSLSRAREQEASKTGAAPKQSGAICSRGWLGASRPAAQVLARGGSSRKLEQRASKHGGAERRVLPREQTGAGRVLAGCSSRESWSRDKRGATTRGARRVLRCRQQPVLSCMAGAPAQGNTRPSRAERRGLLIGCSRQDRPSAPRHEGGGAALDGGKGLGQPVEQPLDAGEAPGPAAARARRARRDRAP